MKTLALIFTLFLVGCGAQHNTACPTGHFGPVSNGIYFGETGFLVGDISESGGCLYAGGFTCDAATATLQVNIAYLVSGNNCADPAGQGSWTYTYTQTDLLLTNTIGTITYAKP